MQLVANVINGFYFRNIPAKAINAHKIDIAVPYITDDTLFEEAKKHQIPCNVWCRIDEDTSLVTLKLLNKYLFDQVITARATHDYLHAKVIYLHGVGCYVGSANLSNKAMHNNIEVGLFIDESQPENEDILDQLRTFFSAMNEYTSSILREDMKRLLTLFNKREEDEQLQKLRDEILKANKVYKNEWEKLKNSIFKDQKIPLYKSTEKSRHNHRVTEEWKQCLELQRNYVQIYEKEYRRPNWVSERVELFTEFDRMFDWYYSKYIDTEKKIPVMKNVIRGHSENFGNSDEKIREMFRWWSDLKSPPDEETDYSFNVRTPVVCGLLAKQNILSLSDDDVAQVVFNCYALMDHIDQFKSYEILGLDKNGQRVPREVKAERYVKKFLQGSNSHGKSFLSILNYFIWEDSQPPWEKIGVCTGSLENKWKFAGIDRSTLGELIGLARPSEYPIRNNRTSRVLNYLGFEVDCV